MLICAEQSVLLLIDLQERLYPAIHGNELVLEHSMWLTGVAQRLAVPVTCTEQYPRGPLSDRPTALSQLGPRAGGPRFTASVAFDYSRQRPVDSAVALRTGQPVSSIVPQSTISGSISFAPTKHWSVSWQTLYDIQQGKFGSHVLRLDRDLHDWRATFSFVQSPNGNVVFNFNIELIAQPEIKFDYDQRNLPAQ